MSSPVHVLDSEVIVPGRPGIVDVVAEAGARVLHVPIGLRAPGDEARYLPQAEDPVLGLFEDEDGVAVASEAVHDSELAVQLLGAITGEKADPTLVRQIRSDSGSVTLAVEDRFALTVYTEVSEARRLGLEMLTALDEVGFNHIAAPIAIWRRGDRDLGIVQEYLPGASIGWAVALTSVRDLYASGGPPDLAGGDFASEARRLGVMTARLHLGLAEAFGREEADVRAWAEALEAIVRPLSPHLLDRPDVADLLAEFTEVVGPSIAIRTHGDLHLGRAYRTEQGWYVGDLDPGGRPSTIASTIAHPSLDPHDDLDATVPVFRSPLADVADMFWSLRQVAMAAARERDPTGREGLVELASAWEERNREFFLAGYLEIPGMRDLLGVDDNAARVMAMAFELERTAADVAAVTAS